MHMNEFKSQNHRRSIRLNGYDYSHAGAYFVTISTKNRECLLGKITDGEMLLNDAGKMITELWESMQERFHSALLDKFIVMPNHFHGIILLNDYKTVSGDIFEKGEYKIRPYGTAENSLGRIIQAFKSLTTNTYSNNVKNHAWLPFSGKLWQRNYYEHVIRSDDSLARIRDYIMFNPLKWENDMENPLNGDTKKVDDYYACLFGS